MGDEPQVKDPVSITLTGKQIWAAAGTLVTVVGAIIAVGVTFQTTRLTNQIDLMKEQHKMAIEKLNDQLKRCSETSTDSVWEKKFKDILPEYLFLQHYNVYMFRSNKYTEFATQENLDTLKSSINDFAIFIHTYEKEILKKSKDNPMMLELEFSTDKVDFARNSYNIPQPVKKRLTEIQKEEAGK